MVYVDGMQARFGNMVMCHMWADTRQELLEMVDKIRVQRKWIQCFGTPKEHFDICLSKRTLAIKHGALEVGWRESAAITKRDMTKYLGEPAKPAPAPHP